MGKERVERRLAAILAADVVGYSRLMEADDEGTLARLKAIRRDLFDPAIARHRGRLVKLTGDGALVEFASAVDAVESAIAIQQELGARAAAEPQTQPIVFRIGINLGDIMVDGGDVYGDGVNIAARLEALAEPNGILISGAVHDEVARRLPHSFDDMGEQAVKNISRQVRVWRLRLGEPNNTEVSVSKQQEPRPERPAIAVLPFANLSGDPGDNYFSDGMVEEIITGLARLRWLMVIARNSSFVYKGRAVDVRQVAKELAVRYVLEGSVRKATDRVRITAQLIDAETGGHVWAERFDGTLADVFDLQDQVTAGVVAAIEPSVRQAEIDRAKRKRPDNYNAYDLFLRALEQAYTFTQLGRATALTHLEAAIALDPDYAEAHGVAAWCRQQRFLWGGRAPADREAALRHANAVAASRSDDATALAFAALALSTLSGAHDTAFPMVERVLKQNPNSAIAHTVSAILYAVRGDREKIRLHADRSLRLSPFDPLRYIAEIASATAHLLAGDVEAALAAARRAAAANSHFAPAITMIAVCLVRLGREDAARSSLQYLLELAPDTRVETLRERFIVADAIGFECVAADLRSVGLPA